MASGSSPLSYQWGFNGTNIDGATNITLTLTNVQPAQAGNYSVQVMNPFGSTNSAKATLVVVAQPTILVQPVNQTLMAGNTAIFSVTAIGFSPLNYQWLFNGTNLAGNTNSLLTLAGVNTNDNGSYQVIVTNSYGSVTSAIATLTLTRSLVVVWGNQTNVPDGLANVTAIAAGSDHNMALEANGTVAAWGGDTFGQTDVPADLTNVVTISAGVSDSLALQSNGKVIGWGFDSGGQINIPQNLTNVVAIAAGGFHSLALRADGTVAAWGEDYYGQTDVPGGLTNVVAIAAGGFHGLALQANGTVVAWGHYGYGIANVPAGLTNVVAIAGGNFHSLALRANGTVAAWGLDESGQTDVPLGLTNVVAITAGAYFSLALQANGTIVGWGYNVNGDTQAPAGLTNVIAITAGNSHSMALENDGSPVVLRQPKSQTALTGTTITFTAAVVGRSQLSYQWQKNGTNLADGGNVSGTTSAALTLANVQTNDAGTYTLVVTNDFGSVTSSIAVLTVLVPPSITAQPASCTNVVGATASFNVVADGTAPLIYQWQSNGTNLVDATNATLTLNNITPDQAGTYSVTVTNLAGSVTSSNAILSVYATAAATLGGYSFSGDTGFQFQVAGVPGFNYAVQESTNLIDWISLITNTAPFSFTDANATNSPQQFYRTLYVP
jgi:alpha-tubulin suppressor-like RCC1 family protein